MAGKGASPSSAPSRSASCCPGVSEAQQHGGDDELPPVQIHSVGVHVRVEVAEGIIDIIFENKDALHILTVDVLDADLVHLGM